MLISRFVRLLRSWWRYNESVRELARLNDRELADIGISRSEITTIAWDNARATDATAIRMPKTPASSGRFRLSAGRSVSVRHFSSGITSGNSPLLWVQPSTDPFLAALALADDRGRVRQAAEAPARFRRVDHVVTQQAHLVDNREHADRVAGLVEAVELRGIAGLSRTRRAPSPWRFRPRPRRASRTTPLRPPPPCARRRRISPRPGRTAS